MTSKGNNVAITKKERKWLWRWAENESTPAILPKSKTAQLALKAKLANVDAERAVGRAYQAEIIRTKAIGEAMFKSGKALKWSLVSSSRQVLLLTESARRKFVFIIRHNTKNNICIHCFIFIYKTFP